LNHAAPVFSALFRAFWRVARGTWRAARVIPGVHRNPFDAAQPAVKPKGLKMADAQVAAKVWQVLEQAV
jgi:acyl-homoserine-lactone acylase